MSDIIFVPTSNGDLVNLSYVVLIKNEEWVDEYGDGETYHSNIRLIDGWHYRSKFRPDEVFREMKMNCWRIKGSVDNGRN